MQVYGFYVRCMQHVHRSRLLFDVTKHFYSVMQNIYIIYKFVFFVDIYVLFIKKCQSIFSVPIDIVFTMNFTTISISNDDQIPINNDAYSTFCIHLFKLPLICSCCFFFSIYCLPDFMSATDLCLWFNHTI